MRRSEMVDVALIKVSAGKGGDGRVSFRREKYVAKGGPNGGDGGDGGSVYLVGERNLRTLDYFAGKQKFEAVDGEMGGKQKKFGKAGEDISINVPQGTIIYEIDIENDQLKSRKKLYEILRSSKAQFESTKRQESNNKQSQISNIKNQKSKWNVKSKDSDIVIEKLGEVVEDGQKLLVAEGGKGGRGNDRFKSATNQVPMEADEGTPGEEKWLVLELKLLADVGLVGLPNAGKSTLLSVLTAARPKIAGYEFTTLEPNLGVMKIGSKSSGGSKGSKGSFGQEVVIADIPGLIEGASKGRGLGDEFLRHVERTRELVHVVGLEPEFGTLVVEDGKLDEASKLVFEDLMDGLHKKYQTIRKELGEYHQSLLKKPELVVINKIDLVASEEREEIETEIERYFKKKGVSELVFVSAATGEGIEEVRSSIVDR